MFHNFENSQSHWTTFFVILASFFALMDCKQCIRSKVGSSCKENHDCYELEERHLYCNKTGGVNVCSFHEETYVGQVESGKDCPGEEYSAEPWSNPVDSVEMRNAQGIDCMRMCLFVDTCFGVSVYNQKCYLKNDKCFSNLVSSPGALVAVLNVVREDYHCGCHYQFTRKRSTGEELVWDPVCPASHLTINPYRCCSEKGLCVKCSESSSEEGQGQDDNYGQ